MKTAGQYALDWANGKPWKQIVEEIREEMYCGDDNCNCGDDNRNCGDEEWHRRNDCDRCNAEER